MGHPAYPVVVPVVDFLDFFPDLLGRSLVEVDVRQHGVQLGEVGLACFFISPVVDEIPAGPGDARVAVLLPVQDGGPDGPPGTPAVSWSVTSCRTSWDEFHADVVFGPPPGLSFAAAPVQEMLRASLANWSFLVRFREGLQLRATVEVVREDEGDSAVLRALSQHGAAVLLKDGVGHAAPAGEP